MTRRSLPEKLRAWVPFLPLYGALLAAAWRSRQAPLRRPPAAWGRGISVLIPESGTPDLLGLTLQHAAAALAPLDEPTQIVVMVNGAARELYQALQRDYPAVIWLFSAPALGFNGAVAAGLHAVQYPAVYLLNSDMRIARDALQHLLPYRTPWTFAVGSQIFFADTTRRREETGLCDYYIDGPNVVIYDKDPGDAATVRGSFYAGGGSSLFRTALLREYVNDSHDYSPFYWEDADWGARAWAEGLECVFVPASQAVHEHRGTIKRRFSAEEIGRIVARNALLFELRHNLTDLRGIRAIGHLAAQDATTRRELARFSVARGVASIRGRSNAAKRSGFSFPDTINKFHLAPRRDERPTVLWVTPFAIFPPSHGGARRIVELARRLGSHLNLVLLSDEAGTYRDIYTREFAAFQSVHLVQGRKDRAGQGLAQLPERMQVHASPGLRYELRRLQQQYAFDLVQVEFMEAALLVEERAGNARFVASLHDVYLDGGQHDGAQLQALRRYDEVIACSGEDAAWVQGVPCEVIGNGAVDRYAQSDASPSNKKVLFMGPFRYQQNFDGIRQFLQQVWPAVLARHADAELTILGGPESAEARFRDAVCGQAGVQLISEFVDPAPWLASCALTINPQQEIRGSALKVAESLLARRICVCTQQGARGFEQLDTGALRVCRSWEAMRDELLALLEDVPLRHALEQSSAPVIDALSWDGKAGQLLALYRRLLPAQFTGESET